VTLRQLAFALAALHEEDVVTRSLCLEDVRFSEAVRPDKSMGEAENVKLGEPLRRNSHEPPPPLPSSSFRAT
jgi:hypothetical protein